MRSAAFLLALCSALVATTSALAQVPDNCRAVMPKVGTTPIPEACDVLQLAAQTQRFAPPPSPWIDDERQAYARVMTGQHVQLLVVPIQVEGAGFDRAERLLMTARIARYLARNAQQRVADPFLAERAFGAGMRTISMPDAERLAVQLGAQQLLLGFAGHDRSGNMRLRFVLHRVAKDGIDRTHQPIERRYNALRFSDELLPSDVLRQMLPRIAADLGFAQRAPEQPRAYPRYANQIWPAPAKRGTSAPTHDPIARATQLQLLGALHPSDEPGGRERAFVKSLVALDEVLPASPDYRLLQARALYYLGRRPAALAALGTPDSPETRALHAALNGNLPALAAAQAQIKPKLSRLIAQIDRIELEYMYDAFDPRAAGAELAKATAGWRDWGLLAAWRQLDWDEWGRRSNQELKALLDRTFPVAGFTAESLTRGRAALGELEAGAEMELSVQRHVRKLLSEQTADWCCVDAFEPASGWDFLDLVAVHAERNLARQVDFRLTIQALPEQAAALLDRYEPLYRGHPYFLALRAHATNTLALRREGAERAALLAQAAELRLKALYLAQGQTPAANFALNLQRRAEQRAAVDPARARTAGAIAAALGTDFPARPRWPIDEPGFTPGTLLALALTRLAYSTSDFGMWSQANSYAMQEPWQSRLAAELKERFVGDPDRTSYQAFWQTSDRAARLKVFEDAMKFNPRAWKNYDHAARMALEDGDYARAGGVFLSYPRFADKDPGNTVALSRYAYDAGSELYRRGAIAEAQPLFRLAAKYANGSDASLTGALQLELLDGDFAGATRDALYRAQRYNNVYGYRDYLALLHVLGYSEHAWSGFDAIKEHFDNPQVWASALIGHRVQSKSDSQVETWLASEPIRTAEANGHRFAANFGLAWYMVDRKPPTNFGKLLERLDSPPRSFASAQGQTVRREAGAPDSAGTVVGPSNMKMGLLKEAPGTPIRSDLAYFADAYQRLYAKDYAGADTAFDALVSHYEILGTYALPYFAWAVAKSGNPDATAMYSFLSEAFGSDGPAKFDHQLGQAFIAGAQGRHADALKHLGIAFRARPETDARPIPTEYQYAQACEWLYRDSGNEAYRQLALDWARKVQRIAPMYAWAYAMEVRLQPSKAERLRAVAIALYLDPHADGVADLPQAEKDRAAAWLKTHNPFKHAPGRKQGA